jgi:hypothetical protein
MLAAEARDRIFARRRDPKGLAVQDEDHVEDQTIDPPVSVAPAPVSADEPAEGRRRAAMALPRDVVRVAYRDPVHICERLSLFAAQRLADPSRDWAQASRSQPDVDLNEVVTNLGVQSSKIAFTQGLVAGTPFYLALLPGYMNYLWQEVRMTLRLAALYGRDPGSLRTAAEMLAMRGVHPDIDAAQAALVAVQTTGRPAKPDRRRPLRLWFDSIRRLLIFGGFIDPPSGKRHSGLRSRLRDALGLAVGVAMWLVTWFFPATFMMMMAWGCERHSRRLFTEAVDHYAGSDASVKLPVHSGPGIPRRPHGPREVASAAGLALSVAIPVGFLAYAVYVRNKYGINWLSALGLLVAVSLVTAAAAYGSRR